MAITRIGSYAQIKGSPNYLPCRVATTASITLSGTQTIDGVGVVAGDRVLVKNQGTGSQNGIYIVAAGAWTRAVDMSLNDDVYQGAQVYINSGTTNGSKTFVLTTTNPITLGSTSLTFTEIAGAGVTGTAANTQVAFWTGTSVIAGTAEFIWNNTNKNLGIGGNPSSTADAIYVSVKSTSPGGQLGANILTTGSGTNWAGTDYATGYTHTPGSTVALTSAVSSAANTSYSVVITMTGRTVGSISITFSGNTDSETNITNTSGRILWSATAGNLVITPTSDFDGTIVVTAQPVNNGKYLIVTRNAGGALLDQFGITATADSSRSVAIGAYAFLKNITSDNSVIIGYEAGKEQVTGSDNIFVGYLAGGKSTKSNRVVAIGTRAATASISLFDSVYVGYQAGQNVNSNSNVGIGANALVNYSGTNTVGIGTNALGATFSVSSSNQVGVGSGAGSNLTSGSSNVFIGRNAASQNIGSTGLTSTSNSIAIGDSSKLTEGGTNEIVIGQGALGSGSNTTTLGNSSTTLTKLFGNIEGTGQIFSPSNAKGNSGTGTVTFNWNDGNVQTVTLTGNCTFAFSNPQSGATYQIVITQDATGSRTITWPTIHWEGDVAPTLTGTANTVDVATFTYDGSKYLGMLFKNFGTP